MEAGSRNEQPDPRSTSQHAGASGKPRPGAARAGNRTDAAHRIRGEPLGSLQLAPGRDRAVAPASLSRLVAPGLLESAWNVLQPSNFRLQTSDFRSVPPFGEVAIGRARPIRVVRGVVEEHQPRADVIAKVQDVQTRRRLIQPVPVTARIESEETAEKQSNGGLVRDSEYV